MVDDTVEVVVNPHTLSMQVKVGEDLYFDGLIFDWTVGRTLAVLERLEVNYSYEEVE